MGDRPDSTTEVLAGLVERVTFHSDESGFCVLRVKARGHRDLVTMVGHAAMISAGEWVTASGVWVNCRTHELKFKAQFLKLENLKHEVMKALETQLCDAFA